MGSFGWWRVVDAPVGWSDGAGRWWRLGLVAGDGRALEAAVTGALMDSGLEGWVERLRPWLGRLSGARPRRSAGCGCSGRRRRWGAGWGSCSGRRWLRWGWGGWRRQPEDGDGGCGGLDRAGGRSLGRERECECEVAEKISQPAQDKVSPKNKNKNKNGKKEKYTYIWLHIYFSRYLNPPSIFGAYTRMYIG